MRARNGLRGLVGGVGHGRRVDPDALERHQSLGAKSLRPVLQPGGGLPLRRAVELDAAPVEEDCA
eukprot:9949427-Lingulodinium_polyedra.AAC.1